MTLAAEGPASPMMLPCPSAIRASDVPRMLQLEDDLLVAVTWAYEVPVLPSQSVMTSFS